ncbi:MAG: peptidoglycan-binding protein [Parvibaculum sp.]|nr:peptidoglycan-binding protein [Parvibaculum sp.]
MCVAETMDAPPDRQTLLVGQMFILDRKNIWPQRVREHVRQARDQLQAYQYTADSPSIEDHFGSSTEEVKRVCSINCYFQASFSLHRSGVVDLFVDSEMQVSDQAPSLPTEQAHRTHVQHILAAQLFFFLKDIGHRHQHHDARTDTIVDLYDVSDEGNDLNWRLGTLYSIYRRIISNKRMRSVNAHFSSLGLLAYAKAFKHVCMEQLPPWLHGRLPTFYDDALEESVRASELDMEHKSRVKQERSETRRNVNIAAFGFAFSLLGLLSLTGTRLSVTPHRGLIYLAEFCVSQPFTAATMILALVFSGLLRPEDRPTARTAFYFLQPFNRFATAAIFIGLGIAVIVAQAYFIYCAFILGNSILN